MTQALKWAASVEEDPLGVGPGERFFASYMQKRLSLVHIFVTILVHIFVTILHIFV